MNKVIKKLLPIVSIVLLSLGLFNIIALDTALLIVVSISGLSTILSGYSLYVNEQKKASIILISTGIFIIILAIITLFFRKL